MEQWEDELDVDDSDLPSLLRPCKKRQQESFSSFPHPSPVLNSLQSSSENLQLLSQTLFQQPPLQILPSRRLIPGPAGAVQTAMFRKAHAEQSVTEGSCKDASISTQDYIRQAVENPEDDDDFKRNPWLSALEHIGLVDGSLPVTPLSSVLKCSSVGRFDQVVAIVRSCTPNGLGDLMVSLKDPTGTIGASVHHKVLVESVCGKDISIGSVLILQKVAVFLPSRYKHYLNITLNNLVKVIPRDCGPPRKHSYNISTVKYADLNGKNASSPRINIDIIDNGSKVNLTSQYIHDNSQAANTAQKNDKEIEPNIAPGKQIEPNIAPGKQIEPRIALGKQIEPRIALGKQIEPKIALGKQIEPSLPEWTDEQLNELFAIEDEGDDFGF